ncbi:tRNA (adenosine(37)-N6)-threonylcarbamoyltransferase complex ATPase subunit type 1 TsaE [Tenacibaculum sp. M341]|uniref:tRNA (adenosine(37)-N6)-threonylcarbamoyltransferase complex ATPase subunit type 1 TsaE n=1 Tax=Tenacibaculum sp. M341 TaxID=2530339 RepID=UPI001046400D|nr:tRNA (adenosine(37)-N6)-threonylcarbamoyltransferase complex ATPase subunit type 1 TsaE [Tenacibaculum sp. M341]TCI91027.1 tRNA (adenosine(37)-N6)-threonylcarbamoyltransferase complex ATPase subunit type 1 TsaE [Tenacibaculum sp. M341]
MNVDYSIDELNDIAKKVLAKSKHKILLFNGEMGVGKTTLIKELCKVLGSTEIASSPTFSLVNEYETNKGEIIYHFDFYRIEDEEEALDIGVEDYFYSNNWCLIEWSENIKNLVPLNAVNIQITAINNNLRNIQLTEN